MWVKIEIFFHLFLDFIKKSFDWFEKAFRLAPKDQAAIYRKIGKKYVETRRVDEAISVLDKAKDINPQNAEVYLCLLSV